MSAIQFKKLAHQSNPIRRTLNRYLYIRTAGLTQTAACGRFHSLKARIVRWLLMTHDRAHRETFSLTHEFLSFMLGVRRAGISEAAGLLQAEGLIHYVRGVLTIVNRTGLEAIACPCYAAQRQTYRHYLEKAPARSKL